ncbi:hypothetical protein Golomagni_06018, partial [Golovinomyces magnicellulatus]
STVAWISNILPRGLSSHAVAHHGYFWKARGICAICVIPGLRHLFWQTSGPTASSYGTAANSCQSISRRTPIGALHRLLWIHIPKAIVAADQQLTSGKVTGALAKTFDVLMHDRHPTIVIFFLLVMSGGEYLYLPSVWPQLSSSFTKLTVVVAVAMPYIFLYLSCASDPGYITPETHSYYMSLYPYDYVNFLPGRFCRTCNLLKPARSKHCSVCKRCVAKADHHCVFINSCVGYKNQHWFILLLVSTGLMALYG